MHCLEAAFRLSGAEDAFLIEPGGWGGVITHG